MVYNRIPTNVIIIGSRIAPTMMDAVPTLVRGPLKLGKTPAGGAPAGRLARTESGMDESADMAHSDEKI